LGYSYQAVVGRLYRIRKKLKLSNPQQLVALIIETLRGAGWSGSVLVANPFFADSLKERK
jgi:hypothetical protein